MPRSVASNSTGRTARVPQKQAFNRPAFELGHKQWSLKELARMDLRAHRVATDSKGGLEIPYRPVSCGSTYGIPFPYHWVYSQPSRVENRPLAAQSWADTVRVTGTTVSAGARSPASPQGSFLAPSTSTPFRTPLHTPRSNSLQPASPLSSAAPPHSASVSFAGLDHPADSPGGASEQHAELRSGILPFKTTDDLQPQLDPASPKLRLPPNSLPPLTVQEYWATRKGQRGILKSPGTPGSRKVFKEGFQTVEVRHAYFG